MSLDDVSNALEVALNGMTPALDTAWENVTYVPTAGVPYQAVMMAPATPDNSENGSNFIEVGFLQVELRYPIGAGHKPAGARAKALRTTFARGQPFTSNATQVLVNQTPTIAPGYVDQDRYVVVVRVPFRACLTT